MTKEERTSRTNQLNAIKETVEADKNKVVEAINTGDAVDVLKARARLMADQAEYIKQMCELASRDVTIEMADTILKTQFYTIDQLEHIIHENHLTNCQ